MSQSAPFEGAVLVAVRYHTAAAAAVLSQRSWRFAGEIFGNPWLRQRQQQQQQQQQQQDCKRSFYLHQFPESQKKTWVQNLMYNSRWPISFSTENRDKLLKQWRHCHTFVRRCYHTQRCSTYSFEQDQRPWSWCDAASKHRSSHPNRNNIIPKNNCIPWLAWSYFAFGVGVIASTTQYFCSSMDWGM